MKKKLVISLIIIFGLFSFLLLDADTDSYILDFAEMTSGVVKARHESPKALKVTIEKDEERYVYNLKNDGSYESYPLQMGDGIYEISVFEKSEGLTFEPIYRVKKAVATDPNKVYLESIQKINWNNDMEPIKKSKALTDGLEDSEKVKLIYAYITENITYDKSIDYLPNDYLPNIETTYNTNAGICYDFASLFASMCRSAGIPTKLIMGTSLNTSGYHAWNEVYVEEQWRTIDTSTDSQILNNNNTTEMYKEFGYKKRREY